MKVPIASFKNISSTIETLISQSKTSIKISVGWFTNRELLGLLTEKVKNGVQVKVIISDDIINRKQNPVEFINSGGEFYILTSLSGKFLHEKFAIFDDAIILSGSYNWTYNAEYRNHESVIVCSNTQLVKQYSVRFKNLLGIVTQYKDDLLSNRINISADIAEEEFERLQNDLTLELLAALEESKKINAKINFDSIYNKIKMYGGIGAAKRLMLTGSENIQSGFIKMWELKRLDLTFEYIVTKDKYRFLFDETTLNIATDRLTKFNQN